MQLNRKVSTDSKKIHRPSLYQIWLGIFISSLLLLSNVSLAQEDTDEEEIEAEELEEAPVVPQTPIEEVVTTGTRLQQNPGELAGQLVVLDEAAIRASGEVTLERLLRQLPQNLNPTTEKFGSRFNTGTNLTGGSTVNLRGLGSESTLILVDGKRIGYNGLLGGVTDVSAIPLAMVERIEIVLDGASAVYGSDAVGGVVNIITRKDYEGIELDVGYDWPNQAGYDESRIGITASQMLEGWRIRGSYQRSMHSGLDAADREITILQQSNFPGPQYDVRFCCLADGTSLPIFYLLDGDALTLAEYNALSDADKARATTVTNAVLPEGFNENSSVDDITEFGLPMWGAATQAGYSVLPERTSDNFLVGVDKDIGEYLSVSAQLRGELRNILNNRGYQTLVGESLNGNSPYNPFGRTIHLRGQRADLPRPNTETEVESLDTSVDLSGYFNDQFDWELSVGRSTEDSSTLRNNPLDRDTLRIGMGSDGVTPITRFLFGETPESCAEKGGTLSFGLCRVSEPPPPAINPFGDLSNLIGDPLNANSLNETFRLDALVRGELFDIPGGTVRALVGWSSNSVTLESSAQFQVGVVDASPIGDIANYNTTAERTNTAVFAELSAPLVSSENDVPWIDSLNLSLSWRNDDYDAPSITYVDDIAGNTSPDNVPAPGAQDSWGVGLVWSPMEDLRVKASYQTAFVAPQLNQLLRATARGPSAPFRGILLIQPDGSLRSVQVLVIEGGNADLRPETADTASLALEYSPFFLPELQLKVTYSDVEYMDRINQLSFFIIDPENLPTNTYYSEEEDMYVQERRWINVSSINRKGVDVELMYGRTTDWGDFDIHFKRSVINLYQYVLDPNATADDASAPISVVGETDGSTILGVVPESSMNGTFSWSYRGVDVNVDYQTRSKTTNLFTGVTSIYKPLSQWDLTISYLMEGNAMFGYPNFLDGARLTFFVNNFHDKFGKSVTFSNNTRMPLEQSGTDPSPIYGRTFGLSLKVPLESPF